VSGNVSLRGGGEHAFLPLCAKRLHIVPLYTDREQLLVSNFCNALSRRFFDRNTRGKKKHHFYSDVHFKYGKTHDCTFFPSRSNFYNMRIVREKTHLELLFYIYHGIMMFGVYANLAQFEEDKSIFDTREVKIFTHFTTIHRELVANYANI
jgi:hypothetical protein